MLEEHQQEEGDHSNKEGPWQENWDVESKCVAGVEEVAGMPDEDWEPAQIKEGTEGVAIERLIKFLLKLIAWRPKRFWTSWIWDL